MFDLKKKLTEKKQKNQHLVVGKEWKRDALLQDCFTALRGSFTVAVPDQREAVEAVVNIALTEDSWVQTDAAPEDWLPKEVFVLWHREGLPVLHCNSALALEHLDDVTAVAAETFLVSENLDRIIHAGHGKLRLYSVL